MAEIDAQEKQKLAALDDRTSAREHGIEETGERQQETLESGGQAAADAHQELAEVATERQQYRNDVSGRLDKLTVRLEATKQRNEVLGSRAPTSIQSDIAAAESEHKLLKQRVAELPAVDPASWAQDKDAIEDSLDRLEHRIDALNKSISDV